MLPPPPRSTLFPYTTLFRSVTSADHLETLSRLGFNRLSMGIQDFDPEVQRAVRRVQPDRKSTRLNSSHVSISYAVFCLKKKKITTYMRTADVLYYSARPLLT